MAPTLSTLDFPLSIKMLDPAIRRRLSDIARGKPPRPATSAAPRPEAQDHHGSEYSASPRVPAFAGCAVENEHGECLVWELRVESFHPTATALVERFRAICPTLRCDPRRVLFLDLETTGLCGVPLFLIGAMQVGDEGLTVSQVFARDYAEEKSVLEQFQQLASDCEAVVTFNGTAFDLPFIRDRGVRHRLKISLPARHVDVLTHARSRWKGKFADCKLQTLETCVCGRYRTGDVPGHQIPQVYHDYVRSGDLAPLLPVFEHNTLDLLTTLELCLVLFE